MSDEETSEFGKGLTYCIALFLEHSERPRHDPIFMKGHELDQAGMGWEMWFNGAADHMYELNVPDKFPKKLADRINTWSSKCLGWRLAWGGAERATEEDYRWAVREARDILMEIDKRLGAEVIKGGNE